MDIEKELEHIFNGVGIYIEPDVYKENIEMDSLQFASVLIEIEEKFMIRLSSDFEDFDKLKTF